MKIFFVLFFIGYAGSPVFAQKRVIDSLEYKLAKHGQQDLDRVLLLSDLAFYCSDTDPVKGSAYALRAISLADRLKEYVAMADSYNYLALNYAAQGLDSVALAGYDKAIALARERGDETSAVIAMSNQAILYSNRSQHDLALPIRLEVLEIFEKSGHPTRIHGALNNLGVTYFGLSDYPRAIEYYFRAIRQADLVGDSSLKIDPYSNIGMIYKKMGAYERALTFYRKAELLLMDGGSDATYASVLISMGNVHDTLGDTSMALSTYRKAFRIAETAGQERLQASVLTNTGVVYNSAGEYADAMHYFRRALILYDRAPVYSAMSVLYSQMGQCILGASPDDLSAMGYAVSDRFPSAEKMMKQSLHFADSVGDVERKMLVYRHLSGIYEQQGRFRDALLTYKEHALLKDSLLSEEKKIAVFRNEVQYEQGRRDAEAADKIRKHRTERNYLIGGSLLLLVAGSSVFAAYKKRQDARKKAQHTGFRAAMAEKEMKVLRLQMNPHFIFNSLNSISDYIGKNDIESADYYLVKFARLMRGILENSEDPEIPLSEELEMVRLYIQLEAMRLNDKFTFEIRVSAEVDADDVMVPPLILQPFVENSVWHGIAPKPGKGRILIEVGLENGMLRCAVEDDGTGRSAETVKPSRKSVGIDITKERIARMNKQNDPKAGVQIIDLQQGTRVEVTLPVVTSA